jgi:cell division protein FtsQ
MTTSNELTRAEMLRKKRLQKQEPVRRRAEQTKPVPPAMNTLTSSREVFHPAHTSPRGVQKRVQNTQRKSVSQGQKDRDFTFSVGKTAVRTPSVALPHPGARWVSGILTVVLGFALYTMLTSSLFRISTANISGMQRLSAEEINAVLGINGKAIMAIDPSIILDNIRSSFPDISATTIRVGLPNRISIGLVERTPVIAWYQDGTVKWLDNGGIAFPQRGDFPGLVQVSVNGSPAEATYDATKPLYEQEFIQPQMVAAILQLAPDVPEGSPMIYDSQYGMGWQDPRGWFVYFGQNTMDIPTKLNVYSAIVDTFMRQGIEPTLVSMEFLDAPFYK